MNFVCKDVWDHFLSGYVHRGSRLTFTTLIVGTRLVYVFFKQDDDRPKDSKGIQGFVRLNVAITSVLADQFPRCFFYGTASRTFFQTIVVSKCRCFYRLLDTLQQAFVMQGTYWYLVTHFDDPSSLSHSTWYDNSAFFRAINYSRCLQGSYGSHELWLLAETFSDTTFMNTVSGVHYGMCLAPFVCLIGANVHRQAIMDILCQGYIHDLSPGSVVVDTYWR